ncbi:hypothetical protein Emed_006591 [Eimeria media]
MGAPFACCGPLLEGSLTATQTGSLLRSFSGPSRDYCVAFQSCRGARSLQGQRINANFHAVGYLREGDLLSLVSAVSAYLRFTACPSPEAHLLAANVLQTLAAKPPAAAAAAARAAGGCSDATRLRLLLLLQPLIATHPERSALCALKAEAFEPLRGPCVHALQAAASAVNSGFEAAAATAAGAAVAAAAAAATTEAAGATTATARDASLLAAASEDAFGVLHLLLESMEAKGSLEGQHTLLWALADAAGALLPLVKEEDATRAAFVCARLLLMRQQTSQKDYFSGSQQHHTNQCSGQLPDAYASSLSSSSSTNSSSSVTNSNCNSNSSSTNSITNTSNSSSNTDLVSLDLLTLRCVLRAPLLTASAGQIEEASAALWMMRKMYVCGRRRKSLVLTAEEGEAAREAQEQAADGHATATLSLLSAAETHVNQAAASRAASLEPKEVLEVVAAVSNCTADVMCSSSSSSMCCSSISSSTKCSSSSTKCSGSSSRSSTECSSSSSKSRLS